ncbi:MAG TPA: DUF885 domain-containing protein, partial [Candidatus Acidoferrum sp.]|nr:DUF885 domain-containing protein [Candidatus Acidoferrum sp.]
MFSKLCRALVPLLVISTLGVTAGAAKTKKKAQTVGDLSEEIMAALQAFFPVHATEMGIHTYDKHLADYSSKSVKQMVSALKGYQGRLKKFEKTDLSPEQRTDWKLIQSNVEVALLDLNQIEWYKKSPVLYVDEAVNGVYFLTLSHHASEAEKLPLILGRMREVPALFTQAQANVKNPSKVLIDAAKESLEAGLEFYRQVAGEYQKQFPARANEILQVSTAAREAMSDYLTYLNGLEPGPEKSFAIGKDNFNYLLAHEYFLTYDSDSLLKIGEALLADAQKAYKEFESYVELNHQNGQDSVFIPASFTRQDVIDYYQWETDQIKTFIKMNGIVTIPDDIAPVTVVQTPPFLHTMISSIAYQPAGPFDRAQQGYFYVRPLPDSIDRKQLDARYRYVHRRGFRGSVVHEAYPGHHLQMQLANHNLDPVRKWQMNTMMIEGWALYCEEMMYHDQLYGREDPAQWLGILGGIRLRAARIVADVKLHNGDFTYDECVGWMTKTLEIESESGEQFVRAEVRRYTVTPTVQMCYLIGKREIESLRAAAMRKGGANFSERSFHDALLAEGSIPPTLMWDIMGL